MRIVLLCLALGVAAIGTVGSLRAAIQGGITLQRRALLGGDLSIQSSDPLPPALVAMLRATGARVSETETLRTMIYAADGRRMLVEARGVDGDYPLVGTVESVSSVPLQRALAGGLMVVPLVADRLGVAPGASLRLGGQAIRLAGTLASVPDSAGEAALAPTVMLQRQRLDASGLIAPGALVTYTLRIVVAGDAFHGGPDRRQVRARALAAAMVRQFPEQPLHIRDVNDAAPALTRVVAQLSQFMTLIGLASLLLGGLGVASGVTAWLEARRETLAVLRTLGATTRTLAGMVMIQLGLLCGAGIAAGGVAALVIPAVAIRLLAGLLPVAPDAALHAGPLLLAAGFGVLVAVLFALPPMVRAMRERPTVLFRAEAGEATPAGWRLHVACAALVLALVGLAAATSPSSWFALGFCGVAGLVLLLFRLAGWAVRRLAAHMAWFAGGPVWWRLGLRALHRPGSPATSMLLALGAGLSTLSAIALIEGNIRASVLGALPSGAPSFYFIDIQPDEMARFKAVLKARPRIGAIHALPSLRTRVVAVDGVPASLVAASAQTRWALRGDHGLSLSAEPPPGTQIAAGRWWPADYAGPPLLSFDAGLARGWGVHVGSVLRLDVLGRDIDLCVGSLRTISWQSLQLNFAFIASPGLLSQAPHTLVATVGSDGSAAGDAAILEAVTDALPDVTGIRVADVLGEIASLVQRLAIALQAMGVLALASGGLVLAATLASGQGPRTREAAILRCLGASSGQLRAAWLVEFAILGAVAGLSAAGIGALLSWLVLHWVLQAPWALLGTTLAATLAGAIVLMLLAGLAATRQAMRASPATLLRRS